MHVWVISKACTVTPIKKLIYDISASAVQMLVTQLSGAVIFFLLSNFLSKQDIGIINWSLALLMILYAILGFGLDQLVVKKIAKGTDPVALLKTYLLHMIITGGLFVLIMVAVWLFLPLNSHGLRVFLLLSVSQLLLFVSIPFKQVASGLEQFRTLLAMSVIANAARVLGLLFLIFFNTVSVTTILYLYILSSLLELIICISLYTGFLRFPIRVQWNKKNYLSLIKEATPQLGVIFLTTIIARVDWVLLGLLTSSVVVADYSFTYRAFELATLPLLVLGPLLLPRISRIFGNKKALSAENNTTIIDFVKTELLLAVFSVMMINLCWSPVIDSITYGRYGTHNAQIIFILSLSIPFLYINNIFWTLDFAQGRLTSILRVFLITCSINIVADLALIPFFQSTGAAVGFVLAIVIQTVAYSSHTILKGSYAIFRQLAIASIVAMVSYFTVSVFYMDLWIKVIIASCLYILLLMLTGKLASGKPSLLSGLAKI